MLELKKKAIIISLTLVSFLFFGIVGCARKNTPERGNVKASSGLPVDSLSMAVDSAAMPKMLSDSILLASDSLAIDSVLVNGKMVARSDSASADSLSNPDDLQYVVKYTARDSTIMEVDKKEVHMYGEAEVTYGTINLKADYIRLNWITNEVYAIGSEDTTTTKMIGEPIFQDGATTYNTKEIRYNFKSKKAIIKGIVTQEGDGNIRGERVKKDEEGNFYIHKAMYTTCNLTHPHFYINAPKIKLVHQKQVISGPFNMVISDVPLPIALPFGFFPFPKKKEIGTSGIIFPTYGEEPNGRGFYLRNGGYYFAINEYVNAQVTGQIYSTGSWGVGLASTYSKRYRYNGSFSFNFNKNRSGDEVDQILNKSVSNDFSILWSHTPKPRGNSTFSANVNVSSNRYNQFQEYNVEKYTSNVASSSVQYNRTFGQYMRAAASLRVNQNFGQVNPTTQIKENGKTNINSSFSFGVNQIAPFALKNARGRWFESFRLGMDFSGDYAVSNVLSAIDTTYTSLGFRLTEAIDTARIGKQEILDFTVGNLPDMLQDAQFTGRYSLPISLPNFKVLRFINLTPSMSLNGEVFTKQYRYTEVEPGLIRMDTLNKAGTQYSYNFGAGINTRFYGTFFVKGKRLEAIRHTVIPSLSFTYTPDFTGEAFGFYQRIDVVDSEGVLRKLSLSKFNGIGSGVSNGRASSVVSFSLNNSFEMKLRSKSDTAATQFEKVSLLDNLSLGGNYNLLADSLNLSNITLNANARIGKNLNLNFNMNLDPYTYVADSYYTQGRKINKFAITQGDGLANLQNLAFTLGTNFSPKQSQSSKPKPGENSTATAEQREFIQQNPDIYVDYTIPWNISLNYNFNLSKPGLAATTIVQAVNVTGDLSLTKNFKISGSTGFDFVAFKPTITQLTLYRDLHCWDMSFSWTPFAGSRTRMSNYSFTLKVKSSILQDLKVSRRRSFYDQAAY
ncbi:putative LPS assembly protein LptD [Dyadobacter tibetensis]|uniref:putative LPS assembly protein LptD n=1 Tax=Dyadobacter tibetensis TaxID=1211851 RepID=UPI00046F05CA|nr:putative LPS assembly protein LptD [Dyadobacter tibetensis]